MKHLQDFFKNSFKCVRAFQIDLEFGSVVFLDEEEIAALEKTSRGKANNTLKKTLIWLQLKFTITFSLTAYRRHSSPSGSMQDVCHMNLV